MKSLLLAIWSIVFVITSYIIQRAFLLPLETAVSRLNTRLVVRNMRHIERLEREGFRFGVAENVRR